MKSQTLYKLTDQNWKTHNDTLWGPGITHHAKPGKGCLCSKYYIHAYTDPRLAILLNPIHADISNPVLWEARGCIAKTDYGVKVGCKKLTTIKIIDAPNYTTEYRVIFGILCALQVCKIPSWVKWADDYVNSIDRSAESAAWAESAARAESAESAESAARAARAASAECAAWAESAARAASAESAARAAWAASAECAAWAENSKPILAALNQFEDYINNRKADR